MLSEEDQKRLSDCAEILALIGQNLPAKFDLRATAKRSRIPAKLLGLDIAMRYRIVELGTASVDAFQRGHGVVGACTTRSIFETTALLGYVAKKIEKALSDGKVGDVDDTVMKALAGSRHPDDKANPLRKEAVNILTAIRHFDKEFPGMEWLYAMLCESTHPNCDGLIGAYQKPSAANNEVTFGPSEEIIPMHVRGLSVGLVAFAMFHNRLSGVMERFTELCDSEAGPKEEGTKDET